MSVAIKIENVSKLYRLGTVGTGTIAHDLNRWWHQIRGKEDPYAKIGQVNDRTKKSGKSSVASRQSLDTAAAGDCQPPTANSAIPANCQLPTDDSQRPGKFGEAEYVWALRDINLEVQQGEILGIIGRNGAGKSTLLKLLSRVTAPTTGSIKTKGRIASLLEVGTGFHPDLTGRENIYMNGAILGMRRHEITRQLDEIVDFSGCGKYLDTPVKRYSSGMMVRLGFAVAANLQCDILIVDEVLAVGDAEFQRKCLGKMKDVARGGRTVLFVSHNMAAVQSLCERAILMNNGTLADDGTQSEIVYRYLSDQSSRSNIPLKERRDRGGDGSARVTSLLIESANKGRLITSVCPLKIKLQYAAMEPLVRPKVMIGIYDENETGIYGLDSAIAGDLPDLMPAEGEVICLTDPIALTAGRCLVNVALFNNGNLADHVVNAASFTIESMDYFGNGRTIRREWMTALLRHKWHPLEG